MSHHQFINQWEVLITNISAFYFLCAAKFRTIGLCVSLSVGLAALKLEIPEYTKMNICVCIGLRWLTYNKKKVK